MPQEDVIARLPQMFSDAAVPLTIALSEDMRLKDIGGIDSLALVRLIIAVERGFAIEIAPREATRLKTVGDLKGLIERKQQPAG